MQELKITSKDNVKIKLLSKLKLGKYREKYSKFVVENLSIIYDALKSGFDFEQLFVTQEFVEKNKERFEFILSNTKVEEYYVVDDKINKSFSNLETPSGVCAVYSKFQNKMEIGEKVIYLNAISDPGNLGTILRSALAFSIKNIVVDEGCADIYNPKTIQATKDSIFKLNIEHDECLKVFKKIKKEMKVFVACVHGMSCLSDFKKMDRLCLVLGNETHGVDKEIENLADGLVRIEINKEIESLNVASAAAIFFYEIDKYVS